MSICCSLNKEQSQNNFSVKCPWARSEAQGHKGETDSKEVLDF